MISVVGFAFHACLLLVLLTWRPTGDDPALFHVISAAWGVCNSIWETLIYSKYLEFWFLSYECRTVLYDIRKLGRWLLETSDPSCDYARSHTRVSEVISKLRFVSRGCILSRRRSPVVHTRWIARVRSSISSKQTGTIRLYIREKW